MNETLIRHWAMLKRIPRSPHKITASQLHDHLDRLGMVTTIRTIQRDLISLSLEFPLIYDQGKPIGWSWRREAPHLSIPGMDSHTALTFAIVQEQLHNALPPSTTDHLKPWFQEAKLVIEKNSSTVFNWSNKIRFVSKSISQIQYEVNQEVRKVVYDSLLNGFQIILTYKAISNTAKPKSYPVHPLGLVITDDGIYLICTIGERKDITTLHMNRIINAVATKKIINIPMSFDIDEIANSSFQIKLGDSPIKLKFKLSNNEAKRLAEAPINNTQRISSLDKDWSLISVTVFDTVHLRRWIFSLSSEIMILEPLKIKNEISKKISILHNWYNSIVQKNV